MAVKLDSRPRDKDVLLGEVWQQELRASVDTLSSTEILIYPQDEDAVNMIKASRGGKGQFGGKQPGLVVSAAAGLNPRMSVRLVRR
jgi:hypothetical protein